MAPTVGLEPTTPGLEVRCAIHCATLAGIYLTHFRHFKHFTTTIAHDMVKLIRIVLARRMNTCFINSQNFSNSKSFT